MLEREQEYIISQRRIAGLRKQRNEYKELSEKLQEENRLLNLEIAKLKAESNS